MKRKIIRIDEEKCNGCGQCIPNCPEGALQIIAGKARLVGDFFCDGLGACLGHCPEGALLVEEREADAYDEGRVMANIVPHGKDTITAHLRHLQEHNQRELLRQATAYLHRQRITIDMQPGKHNNLTDSLKPAGCPGSQSTSFVPPAMPAGREGSLASHLTHWPIQLHLISPLAPHFAGSNLLLAADCVSYSMGNFHEGYLKGRTLVIGCPKLDDGQDAYLAKLIALIDSASIQSLTVMVMQVPCCSGLFQLARKAVEQASRKIPIHYLVVGIRGEILQQGSV